MGHSTQTEPRTETKVETKEKVHIEDVDDVIGLAAQMKDADAERLTVAELEEVAAELDIDPEYVRQAVQELKRRRGEAARLQAQTKAQRSRLMVNTSIGAAVVLGALCVALVAGQSSLSGSLAEVERASAQVTNVLERQEATKARLADAPASAEREAELSGAENRVRIERRRYDEAASDYNTRAGGFPGVIVVRLFGMPQAVELSNVRTF